VGCARFRCESLLRPRGGACFPTTYHLREVLEGYDKLRRLAESPAHIVPGHDPLVLERYASVKGLEGIAARLDLAPLKKSALTKDIVTRRTP
jgi:glyoxylase-like metal-dependent hydrolase (beta-lactamase superfamily II)